MAARLHEVQDRIKQLSQLEPQVADLERQKQLQETNYKYFQGTLEKARVDEALDPSKIPNISAVQRATPPALVTTQRNKLALMLAGGGLAESVQSCRPTEAARFGYVCEQFEAILFHGPSLYQLR